MTLSTLFLPQLKQETINRTDIYNFSKIIFILLFFILLLLLYMLEIKEERPILYEWSSYILAQRKNVKMFWGLANESPFDALNFSVKSDKAWKSNPMKYYEIIPNCSERKVKWNTIINNWCWENNADCTSVKAIRQRKKRLCKLCRKKQINIFF